MIKIKMTLDIGLCGCSREDTLTLGEIGYGPEDWNSMTPQEKEDVMNEVLQEWMWNYIDIYWKEVEQK